VTSLPPDAAGRGDADQPAGAAGLISRPPSPPPAAGPPRPQGPQAQPPARPPARPAAPPRASNAPVELSLDLRFTPPDKVLPRLFGALERIGADVTLVVLLRDTPEYASVAAGAYQALRARGYVSDSARFPPGGQRLRVQRPRERAARPPRPDAADAAEPPLREPFAADDPGPRPPPPGGMISAALQETPAGEGETAGAGGAAETASGRPVEGQADFEA
jgi:hypothetical protein